MNVLSLFDGIACGRIALERAGITVANYYASEIDKYAIQIAKKNYPDILHVGDVSNVHGLDLPKIDLLIGGSPCQGFSSSGKLLNFDDPRSKLFFEYVRLLKECKPKYFLLENVIMKKEYQNIISEYLGVEPILINSALVSAQNRERLYWTNIPGVRLPPDKRITLIDVLDNKTFIRSAAIRTRPLANEGHRKSLCLEVTQLEKALCLLTTHGLNNLLSPLPPGRYPDVNKNNYSYRKMTTREMEILQTVPVGYTGDISDTRAAKMLGNGWTVDVIAHLLENLYLLS